METVAGTASAGTSVDGGVSTTPLTPASGPALPVAVASGTTPSNTPGHRRVAGWLTRGRRGNVMLTPVHRALSTIGTSTTSRTSQRPAASISGEGTGAMGDHGPLPREEGTEARPPAIILGGADHADRRLRHAGPSSVGRDDVQRLHAQCDALVNSALQLDGVQSELLSRSLRLRNETKAHIMAATIASAATTASRGGAGPTAWGATRSLSSPLRRGRRGVDGEEMDMSETVTDILGRHAVAYGQARERDTGSLDATGTSIGRDAGRVSWLSVGAVVCKDVRLLPNLRRDFARAISLAMDAPGGAASSYTYLHQLARAVGLMEEARTALHSVVADALYGVVEALDTAVRRAVRNPATLLPAHAPVPASASGASTATVSSVLNAYFGAMLSAACGVWLRALVHEAGEAVRLLLRVRAFLAQLRNRHQQLQDTLASTGLLAETATGGDATRRRRWSMTSEGGGDEANPIAQATMDMAAADAGYVEGEFSRVWEFRRLRHPIDKGAVEPVTDARGGGGGMMVGVLPMPGMRSPLATPLARDDDAHPLSPRSPIMSPHALAAVPVSASRTPPFDPHRPQPPDDIPLYADVVAFLRLDNAVTALIACCVPASPAVAEEDALAWDAHSVDGGGGGGGGEGMSTLVLEHNVPVNAVKPGMTTCAWLCWRHALVLWSECQRERMGLGLRDVWTSVATPPKPAKASGRGGFVPITTAGPGGSKPEASPTPRLVDVSRASPLRRMVDVHLATCTYRFLEAAALVHLYPMA